MAKKLSKEQLETDALVTTYARAVTYYRNNSTKIIGIGVALVVLIGSIIGFSFYNKGQERAAQSFLGYAETFFVRADYETALKGDNSVLGIGLEAIIKSYGSTNAANMARYYAAISEYELGNRETALSYMNRFNPPRGILGVGAISFHAVLLDNAGEYKKASDKFRKAAEWDINANTTPQNLLRAAQSSLLANDYRTAENLVNRILNEYENSTAATQARKIQGMIAVK